MRPLTNTPKGFQSAQFPLTRLYGVAPTYYRKISSGELNGQEVLHYSIPNVQEYGTGRVEDGTEIDSDKWVLRRQCVLVSKLNPRKSTICLADPSSTMPSVASTEFVPLETSSSIDNRFLSYVLQTSTVTDHLSARTESATRSHQRVNPGLITSLGIPWPDSSSRTQIVNYLDRETAEIDALIEEQTDLLALLHERRSSLIDSSLSALGSARIPLKHCGSLSTGLTLGATYNEPVSSHPYIRVANVQAGRLDLSTIAEVEVPDRVAETRRLEPGDVLMTEGGDRDKLGRGALWSGEIEGALHQNHVFAFRCGPYLEPRFLVYVLESSEAREYFEATASQSTNLASTNSTLVKRFKIPRVPVHTQREVVDELESEIEMLEVAGEEATQLIQLAEERRSALISAAVTGQIDVTDQDRSAAEQVQEELEVRV